MKAALLHHRNRAAIFLFRNWDYSLVMRSSHLSIPSITAIEMKQKGVLGKPCPDYVDETVSMKVVRIIQGYVNVVNKMVWRKY